jgi:transcriptional regulator with XRE-family HTH domain
MSHIDVIFQESLKYFVAQERSQRSFAAKVGISAPYLNDLLNQRRYGEDQTKRKIAESLGYPGRHYEDFLDIGRIILKGRAEDENPLINIDQPDVLSRFLPLDYSEQMVLGKDNLFLTTYKANRSHIAIHGPSIRRSSSRGLHAFKVNDDSMEPVIGKNCTVVVDFDQNDPKNIKEGRVYIVCWQDGTGQCALRYLNWDEKSGTLILYTEKDKHKLTHKSLSEVKIIGRVIQIIRSF